MYHGRDDEGRRREDLPLIITGEAQATVDPDGFSRDVVEFVSVSLRSELNSVSLSFCDLVNPFH